MKAILMFHSILPLAAILMAATASCTERREENQAEVRETAAPIVEYCQRINYGDTAALHSEKAMERRMAAIVKLLLKADSASAREGLTILFEGLRDDEKALSLAGDFANRFLNGPSSPVRDEGKYIELLATLLDVDSLPEVTREVATERLRIASLNRPGTTANDFVFEQPDGTRRSLHDIKSPLTLVIFYNPECSPCEAILKAIAKDENVNRAIEDGQLFVLAVYAEGDRKVWRNNLSELPSNWTVGYDSSDILDNELYDLPAMPTLYLLDSEKRVLLKDPDSRFIGKQVRRLTKR